MQPTARRRNRAPTPSAFFFALKRVVKYEGVSTCKFSQSPYMTINLFLVIGPKSRAELGASLEGAGFRWRSGASRVRIIPRLPPQRARRMPKTPETPREASTAILQQEKMGKNVPQVGPFRLKSISSGQSRRACSRPEATPRGLNAHQRPCRPAKVANLETAGEFL